MRPNLPGIGHEFVEANGLRFSVATAGSGDRLALCLHGFPECWYSWHHQMPMLADLGYRVWAPDLRGYGETSRPRRVSDYALENLIEDVAALIDASGAKSTVLLGHDWGGMIAWWFAVRAARPLERLVIFNVPHPVAASRRRMTWRQRSRSLYVLFFQLPYLPERTFGKDAANIPRIFRRVAGRPDALTREDLEIFRASAAEPGGLTAMVNYYRALLRGGYRRQLAAGTPPIETPTLVMWGAADPVLGFDHTHGLGRHVPNLTIRYLPGVGHWSQQEAPEDANRLLAAWLDDEPVPVLPGDERYRETPLSSVPPPRGEGDGRNRGDDGRAA